MKKKRFAARALLVSMLITLLSPFSFAAEDGYSYGMRLLKTETANSYSLKVNGDTVEYTAGDDIYLVADDRVSMTLSYDYSPSNFTLDSESKIIEFAYSEYTSGNDMTYSRSDVIIFPDGTYAATSVLNESFTFDDLHLLPDEATVNFSFLFEGEYDSIPITFDEVKSQSYYKSGKSAREVDRSQFNTLRIRIKGHTNAPVPLGSGRDWNDWFCFPTEEENITLTCEADYGNGWQPIEITSYEAIASDPDAIRMGANFLRYFDFFSFKFDPVQTEHTGSSEPSHGTSEPEAASVKTVATCAAAAAVGAVAVSSAVSATANTLSVSVTGANTALVKPSVIINGGGACPNLVNTKKATVELSLNMDTGFGEIYKWTAFAMAPECIKSVTAAAIPMFGEASTAAILISGEKLPKNKASVFIEIKAVGFDGEEYTGSTELTIYEKGIFAELNDDQHPDLPTSYTVTKISDANLDGIAEIKTLTPDEYTVKLLDGKAVIKVGDEIVTTEL